MTTLSFLLAINGGALVAAVVALWRARSRIRQLKGTLDARRAEELRQAERALPNRGTKFRIVYYTDTGARARNFFATITIGGGELAEFWHYDVLRDTKNGA